MTKEMIIENLTKQFREFLENEYVVEDLKDCDGHSNALASILFETDGNDESIRMDIAYCGQKKEPEGSFFLCRVSRD